MSDSEALMAAHDVRPDGVYLVEVWDATRTGYRHGIFTTGARAKAWMDTQPEDWVCICAPFILNEPDYGNIPLKEQH